MAELTKSDSRQPMGKIKPTDKMVMMPSLFDGTKPATSKQHYERFNLYVNFQTKSDHLTDPVMEGIDLFEHTLDKTTLVWFQMNKSKFKDITMLKTMFLQRYNPWGKMKREQLQSWNILSFNPAKFFLPVFSLLCIRSARCSLGNGCERFCALEIFVRVLRSSEVNLNNVNNTNVFCCV